MLGRQGELSTRCHELCHWPEVACWLGAISSSLPTHLMTLPSLHSELECLRNLQEILQKRSFQYLV